MAPTALRKFRALYALEKQFKDLTVEQRYLLRQEKSKPLMADLKQWCDDNVVKTTKDSLLGKAIRYTINQWDTLVRYLEDGNLQIDNNAAERRIKPFVIGRKNWRVAAALTRCRPRRTVLGALHHTAPSLSHPQWFRVEVVPDSKGWHPG